jgi:hypothetical protein
LSQVLIYGLKRERPRNGPGGLSLALGADHKIPVRI